MQDLSILAHRAISSYLHASEALATGAAAHEMQALYSASITRMVIHARPMPEETREEELYRRHVAYRAAITKSLIQRRSRRDDEDDDDDDYYESDKSEVESDDEDH